MNAPTIQSDRLDLVLESIEEVRAGIAAMPSEMKEQLSADWLAQLEAATEADPWVHGFKLVHRETGEVVGQCGFKGPPDADGAVEIAYGIAPEHQGQGYATEAAQAQTTYAFNSPDVKLVRAHTLREPNASTRVLTKCGFEKIGDFEDPEDGLVWRWEKTGGAK